MKRPAFQFYPADWKGSKWVRIDPTGPLNMPALPACYVVLLDGLAVYVGQTANLRKRFQNHRFAIGYGSGVITPWGSWRGDQITLKVRFGDRFGDWAMRELRLIARLQPSFNCVGSTRNRART